MPLRTAVLLLVLCALAGCVAHETPLRSDQTATLSGRKTAGMSMADTTRTVLIDAARIAVDHGGRYFSISTASGLRPGTDVIVKVYQAGEVKPDARRGLWDAEKILTQGVPVTALNAPARPPAAALSSPQQTPRCTAYGCVW